MTFYDLNIIPEIIRSIEDSGYETPSPIQEEAIPVLLEGKDILGSAQTGTGKTLAFAVPILQHLANDLRKDRKHKTAALILTPTRELANQIGKSFRVYGKHVKLRHTVIYGGVSQRKQAQDIRRGVDIIIATPGRLLDLVRQKILRLNDIKYLVLDEADRMLDMGFIGDVREIIKHVHEDRQTMFFSATMPREIEKLSQEILKDPERIMIAPVTETIDQISQSLYHVSKKKKTSLLIHLMESLQMDRALVFTRTKHGADRVVKQLLDHGIKAEAIHGNKSQAARERALFNLKKKRTQVLVATDVASRGIDIKDLAFVLNYDLPEDPETYIHRIGRTGRAGSMGIAITFCDVHERKHLRQIEKHIDEKIQVVGYHPFVEETKEEPKNNNNKKKPNKKKFYYGAHKNKKNNTFKKTANKKQSQA